MDLFHSKNNTVKPTGLPDGGQAEMPCRLPVDLHTFKASFIRKAGIFLWQNLLITVNITKTIMGLISTVAM
jgi:hypothetical protein